MAVYHDLYSKHFLLSIGIGPYQGRQSVMNFPLPSFQK